MVQPLVSSQSESTAHSGQAGQNWQITPWNPLIQSHVPVALLQTPFDPHPRPPVELKHTPGGGGGKVTGQGTVQLGSVSLQTAFGTHEPKMHTGE